MADVDLSRDVSVDESSYLRAKALHNGSPINPARRLNFDFEGRLGSPIQSSGAILDSQGSPRNKRTTDKSCSTNLRTPKISRTRRTSDVYSDRFIPSRMGSLLESGFSVLDDKRCRTPNAQTGSTPNRSSAAETTKDGANTMSMLLRSELLGLDSPPLRDKPEERYTPCTPNRNIFKFKSTRQTTHEELKRSFTLSSLGTSTERFLVSPVKTKRKIPKVPFKVLDAPALQDDFYLNLVDWSSQNVLAVGLGSCVYLWSACTSKVTKLCDLGPDDSVTSVAWTQRGTHLAVGTNLGEVQIWEASRCKKIRVMGGHSARIGTMAWNSQMLASGSRDRLICLRDVRCPEPTVSSLVGHKQEICGLKWSFDEQQLASGGNDNKLFIWNARSSTPVLKFNDHTAAVKAIAWSPHQNGLLASGGGTADRCIRFWNTLTGTALSHVDTGSQVCNLMFSKNVNEIVSTHGYSLNQIIVWKYPSMTKVTTLTGHTYRVLYLAMSPDGQTIVTGAGDETLRFWSAFPTSKDKDGSRLGSSLLFPSGSEIR